MSIQMKSRSLAIVAIFAGLSALSIGPAAAQVAADADANPDAAGSQRELEEVVVTGSLIKRAVGDVAQPITTVEAEDLVRSGATNAEQIVQQIAQNQAFNISNINLGANTGGGAYANLRSLGSARTLVLLNGKRIVNNPYQTIGVDLNTVPLSLIDKVEVLTDGGSATYGTDAIAGVMNFITAKELTGLTVSATAATPEANGGGESYLANIGGGVGSLAGNGWNIYAGGSWRKARELPQTARDFSRTGFIPERGVNRLNAVTFPANYAQPMSGITGVNPTNPACSPPFSLFGDGIFGPRSCGYDQLAHIDIVTPQEQWSALGRASVQLGGAHVASLEYVRAENEVFSIISPQGATNLSMTAANPFYPGQGITPGVAGLDPAQPITFGLRTEELGRRENTFEGFTDRTLAQLEGELAGWDYEVSAMLSSSRVSVVFTNGHPNEIRLRDGFTGANGAPFLNPFGPQTPAGLQFLESIEVNGEAQRAEGELWIYGVQFNRDLFRLPAGAVALAIAADYKEEEADFVNNPAITSVIPSSFVNSSDISGSRDSKSLAVETSIPVLESLELGLSARYDDYSDFGDTTNPEVSLRYEPIEALVVRGSYSTGFRAPTLYDVFQPITLVATTSRYNDPVLCPGGVVNTAAGGVQTRDCQIQFARQTGGSPNLDAEESAAYSVGFVLKPMEGLSFGVDYWDYHLKQTISPLAEQAIFADPVKYAALIVRCSQVPATRRSLYSDCVDGLGGDPIAYVDNVVQNLGDTRTSGFDATAEWTSPEATAGQFGIKYRGTYVSKYEFQREPGGEFFSKAGQYFDTNPVIRYVHFLTFSWDRGPWTAELTNRYKSAYTDCNAQCLVAPQFFNDVESDSLWDVSATYRGLENLTLSAAVVNLLDEDPPFSNKNIGVSVGYDNRYSDARLRSYLLTVTYGF